MWREGLFMMPQHLQVQDAYHERLLESRVSAAVANSWGVSELEVDAEELARGIYSLSRCVAVMPDGLVVETVKGKPLSAMASSALRPGVRALELFLAVPAASAGGGPAAAEAGRRYVEEVLTVADSVGAAQDAEVDVLRPNARILVGGQDRQSYVTIKIGELVVGESGRLQLSDRYIPPLLRVSASPILVANLGRLVSALGAKQRDLVSKYGHRTAALVEFGAADIATFLYLHTVNTWLPVFMHAADSSDLHPESLYLSLASLAGQLASFEATSDPLDLPRFRYTDLGGTFVPLFDLVFRLLGTVVSARYQSITLEQTQPGLFVGRSVDPMLLRERVLYLIAGGDVPEETLRDDLPRYIKVGSIDQIAKVVHSALPGVTVRLDHSPPNAIPVRAHMIYLKLDKQGRYWDSILQSGNIAIYQPVKPDRVKLDLVAVEA